MSGCFESFGESRTFWVLAAVQNRSLLYSRSEQPAWQALREALGYRRKLRVLGSLTSLRKIWMLLSACTSDFWASAAR